MRKSLKYVLIFTVLLVPLSFLSAPSFAGSESCLNCHSNHKTALDESTHPSIACSDCHLGNPAGSSKVEAHQGLSKEASSLEIVDKTCGQVGCHQGIVETYKTSIHATVSGLKHGAVKMLGEEEGSFVGENNCGSCHATCSDCHLELDSDGKTIAHAFTTDPASQNCKACHDQTGTGYIGYAGEFDASVHAKMGMTCADCHNGEQVHGTGEVEQAMAEIVDNKCVDCHSPSTENVAHRLHQDTVDCSACHVDWYYNCYGCHGYDENGQPLGYDNFNTNRYLAKRKDNGKIASVVHIPMSEAVGGSEYTKGAWVFKDRHSTQKNALECQDCHLNAQVFIMDQYREAPFSGPVDGEFIDKQKVMNKILIFRSHAKLMDKPLKPGQVPDSECLGCHS